MNQSSILQMSQIQENTFKRAIVLLDSMKCVYAIMDPLGNKHGTLNVNETKKIKRLPKHPHGQRSDYIRKYLASMLVGDVVQIPFDKFGWPDIQTSVGSIANRIWGRGSATSTMVQANKVVEVLRII